MHMKDLNTNGQLHRGSFADGEPRPDLYPEPRHVGTFAEGQANPETYPGEDEVGTFAEGNARPDEYGGEDHESTFAEGATTVMSQTPSIDYRCARCGARRIYQLVPLEQRPTEDEVRATRHEIPSIDLRCSRCGASQTYKLVPDRVLRTPDTHQDGNAIQVATALDDPTQDREIGVEPYESPHPGREVDRAPEAGPTRAR
jgi:DNA-directed RNA polymerase subunit RPC12/RpoP